MNSIPRPLTLHVEHLNTDPPPQSPVTKPTFTIDAEMDAALAAQLLEYLEERVEEHASIIRIRLTGRIVLS